MRVPCSWLREYCDPGLDPEGFAERLSMTGTEVVRISRAGAPSADGFVVGRVLAVEPHPNADRLTVCEVDTGGETRTIVCGAPNVAAGQTVPVALPGAVLPGGQELGRAELRGVVSDGMILSEAELKIGDDAAGIAVLADRTGALAAAESGASERQDQLGERERAGDEQAAGLIPGAPLTEVLPVSEPVLELEVTPNRPDCLGIYGVAREIHAVTGASLAPVPWGQDADAEGEGGVEDYASVAVEVPELCPRFTARVFTDVRVGPSPLWLKARLTAAGQRPINNVVDITNYVMLLTAQPLHAFDLDRVPGGQLIVRTADDGERMTTLDGIEREFDSETVLVCDREGPSGIAGIMGGALSEVSEGTTRVLLEVATWNGVNILRTSNALGLRSEASTRFEKQLHPDLALRAQRIASQLLIELCGARLVPGTIRVDAGEPNVDDPGAASPEWPERPVVHLRFERSAGLLGMPIEADRQVAYLERLGFGVERHDGELGASVPPERHVDVTREADLIEEVARIHGLDEHLPAVLPEHGQRGRLTADQLLRRRVEDAIRDLGFDEIVPWSFADPALADRLRLPTGDPRRGQVAIHNPLSEVGSQMRTMLLGGLLDAARYNLAHGAERVALFESGRVYLPRGEEEAGDGGVLGGVFAGELSPPVHEPHRLGCLVVGSLRPPSWRGEPGEAGFYELKGVLDTLCGALGARSDHVPAQEPFLHPGRAAAVILGGRPAGWLGELHPLVAAQWDLPGGSAFEIELAPLAAVASSGHERYEDVIAYPAVHQDVAVVVSEDVPAEQVREAVLAAGGELLRSARIFDLYRGAQIGEGRKSLALRLEFRAPDRTLTDEEVGARRDGIRRAVEEIGGSLRE